MIHNARRSSAVIRRVRALAQKRDPHYARLSINAMVEESAELVGHELQTHRVVFAAELAPEEPLVRGDRVQLQQVIVNLLMNGVQAMASVTDRPRRLTVRTRHAPENRVFVAVAGFRHGDIEGKRDADLQRVFYHQGGRLWGWACRSADRSSRRMAERSGSPPMTARVRPSSSRCHPIGRTSR